MSSHYDIELAFNLREDAPPEVLSAIAFLVGQLDEAPDRPDHPYFTDYTWRKGAFANYLTGVPNRGTAVCSFGRVYRFSQQGKDHYQHTFHLRCECRLEDIGCKFVPFVQWAAAYCDQRQFVGYFLEEYDAQPTLIYLSDGGVFVREVREPPQSVTNGSPWPERPRVAGKKVDHSRKRKPWWKFWTS